MLKALTLLVLVPTFAGQLAAGPTPLTGDYPPRAQLVEWGGEEFSTPGGLAAWLRQRDLDYETWASNHRRASARLERREGPPSEAPATSERPSSVSGPARDGTQTFAPPAGRQARSDEAGMLRLALIGLALALVALAGVQGPLLRVVKFPAALRERRAELATAGIAILIGIGAARLL